MCAGILSESGLFWLLLSPLLLIIKDRSLSFAGAMLALKRAKSPAGPAANKTLLEGKVTGDRMCVCYFYVAVWQTSTRFFSIL